MKSINDLFEPLIQAGLVSSQAVVGCTDEELAALMDAQGVTKLPGSYQRFMRYGGKSPYWLSRDGEWDYDWLLEAKDIAREIVTEEFESDFTPFEQSFVFQTHQGYIFYYFRYEDLEVEDPNFWIFEGGRPVRASEISFGSWLSELADYLPKAVELRRTLGIQ